MYIEFKYQEKDQIAYQLYCGRRISFRNRSWDFFIMILPSIMLILNIIVLKSPLMIGINIVVLLVFMFWYFKGIIQSSIKAERKMKNAFSYYNIEKTIKLSFESTGIKLENEVTSSFFKYTFIKEISEIPTHVFLICENASAIVIPKDSLTETEKMEITNLIERKISSK